MCCSGESKFIHVESWGENATTSVSSLNDSIDPLLNLTVAELKNKCRMFSDALAYNNA